MILSGLQVLFDFLGQRKSANIRPTRVKKSPRPQRHQLIARLFNNGVTGQTGVIVAAMLRRKFARPFPFFCRQATGAVRIRSARTRSRPRPSPGGGRLAAAGRSVCRKYRKASIRRLQQQEYDKLCRIVPALATRRHRRRISKVTVASAQLRNTFYCPKYKLRLLTYRYPRRR